MILNLTQHAGTPDQGVTEPEEKGAVKALLDFPTLPSWWEIEDRAAKLAALAAAAGAEAAMIGGAPYLMGPLEAALKAVGVQPLYAYSVRESVEEAAPDGTVRKTNIFRHAGWVEA